MTYYVSNLHLAARGTWKRRWFALRGSRLCFSREQDSPVLGSIDLQQCTRLTLLPRTSKRFLIEITLGAGRATVLLAAPDARKRLFWFATMDDVLSYSGTTRHGSDVKLANLTAGDDDNIMSDVADDADDDGAEAIAIAYMNATAAEGTRVSSLRHAPSFLQRLSSTMRLSSQGLALEPSSDRLAVGSPERAGRALPGRTPTPPPVLTPPTTSAAQPPHISRLSLSGPTGPLSPIARPVASMGPEVGPDVDIVDKQEAASIDEFTHVFNQQVGP